MKRIFLLAGAVFCTLIGIFVAQKLPADNTELIEEKYDTWAGVIRIWVSESCGAGGWLEACSGIIEKAHDGVYVNIQVLPDDTIAAYASSGVNPPDILIYNNGLIDDFSLLAPIAAAYPLRSGIRQDTYAVPVLLRPRFWIYDQSAYGALPGDMGGVAAACAKTDIIALTALCTGLRPSEGIAAALPGLDLGLAGEAQVTPEPAGGVACRVATDIITDAAPRRLYTDNSIDAFVGGAEDALRLDDCAATATGDYAYASEVIMCSITDKDDGRAEICRAFLDTLMGDGQTLAARAQAFPAVESASAWEGNHILASVEETLRGKIWLSGAYDETPAYLYIEGKISADEAVKRIIGGKK